MTEIRRVFFRYTIVLPIIPFFFTVWGSLCLAQPAVDRLQQLWYADRLDELHDELPGAVRDFPDSPTVLYFQGVFEQNGEKAMSYFQRIVRQYPDSKFAADALFRMGQFYYTRNEFSRSRRYFSFFIKTYKHSQLYDDAYYLYCQSLLAQGKTDSARTSLQSFIREERNSPYVDLAVLDLEFSLSKTEQQTNATATLNSQLPGSKYHFTLQLGAFKNRNNALKMAAGLREHGLPVRVEKIRSESRMLWAVRIGRFETRELAINFADKHSQTIGSDYRIVNFNER